MRKMQASKGGIAAVVAAYLLLAAALAVLAVNPALDIRISGLLHAPRSVFGLVFEVVGYWPTFGGLLLAGVLLARTRTHPAALLGWGALAAVGAVYVGYFSPEFLLEYLGAHAGPWLFAVPVLVLLSAALAMRRVPQQRLLPLRGVAGAFVVYTALAELCAYSVKIPWGRARYRDFATAGFTPWWQPQGVTGHQSFFSGHTAESCGILLVAWLLPVVFPSLGRFKPALYAVAAAWMLCVATSRVVVGAHYASDVIMGMAVGLTLFLVTRAVWGKRVAWTQK